MKPYFFKSAEGNIGDDINAWIWHELLPEEVDDNSNHLLVGIGTLLNHRIPQAAKYTVISSGVGYGNKPKLEQGEWNFIGVRGPISQEQLGIERDISLLDGAYLLPQLRVMPDNQKTKIGYIPHVESIIFGNWEAVCERAGIELIDPRKDIDSFLTSLSQCKYVVTEAMHGAIISDAYGIPWIPAKAHDHINERKWLDWSMSVDVDVRFNHLNPVWKGEHENLITFAKNSIKRNALIRKVLQSHYTPAPHKKSNEFVINSTAKKLIQITQQAEPQLSSRSLIIEKTARLNHDINTLKYL